MVVATPSFYYFDFINTRLDYKDEGFQMKIKSSCYLSGWTFFNFLSYEYFKEFDP